MSAFDEVPPLCAAALDPQALAAFETIKDAVVPSARTDGWAGFRQKRFLEAIADGETVRDACRVVQLSPASAYAFRRTAKGRAFDLGWKAADLLARERVAADLLTRAVQGQEVETLRPDGTNVLRRFKDNRLAVQMLARLDRYADASEATAPGHAARLVAGDFEAYLQLLDAEGGPARAGLFMLAHGSDGEGTAAALEPVVALARADRLLRCGTLAELGVADLDPARRAEWTAEQWARAEAAGLVALAPPPPTEPAPADTPSTRQPCSTSSDGEPEEEDQEEPGGPVYWCGVFDEWRTRFPPADDFLGREEGDYGDEGYNRQLSEAELAVVDRPHLIGLAAERLLGERARDRFFAEAARAAGEEAGLAGVEPEDVAGLDEAALRALAGWRDRWVGEGIESADRIGTTMPSPAGGSAQPNPFDVKGEAALAFLGGDDAGNDNAEEGAEEEAPTPAPRAKPASSTGA